MESKHATATLESAEPLLGIERNSIVLEDWFDQAEWPAKLAAVMLNSLLTSDSPRLSRIGEHILERLQEDVIETEGLTAAEDMFIREIFLTIKD